MPRKAKPKSTAAQPRARKRGDPADPAVKDYRYDARRLNNPPAGLTGQKPTMAAEGPPKVEYDPHKPPVLRFDPSGAADRITDLLAKAKTRPLTEEEVAFLESALANHQPWLEWSGKREQDAIAVDDVALHVHERVSAQAVRMRSCSPRRQCSRVM